MSSIPTSAMPHAHADEKPRRTDRTQQLRDLLANGTEWAGAQYDAARRAVRNDRRIPVAAGIAAFAALAAVFAPSLWRRRAAIGL